MLSMICLGVFSMTIEWMDYANCKSIDPDYFHPSETGKWNVKWVNQALNVCARCPVQVECLTWALETGDMYAILGGTTPEQRVAA